MISPELLLRYPFFGNLKDSQLTAVAMLSHEIYNLRGDTLFSTGEPADTLYFLLEGSIDLHYEVTDPHDAKHHKEFYVGHINPGEPFGISALIEPHRYTASAKAASACRILAMDANVLRAHCQADSKLAATLLHQIAKTALARMNETRVQLAATLA